MVKNEPDETVKLLIVSFEVIYTLSGLEMVKLSDEVRFVSHASEDFFPGLPYSGIDACQLAPK